MRYFPDLTTSLSLELILSAALCFFLATILKKFILPEVDEKGRFVKKAEL